MKSIGWDTSFHLNGKFPLLDNSIFPTLNAAKKFINDQTSSAIAGTIIGVDNPSNINESGLYEIFSKSGKLALRKLVSEDILAEYKEGVDTIINNYEGNYSSLLLELAAALAELLEALRGEIFSPDNDTTPVTRTMMLLVGSDSTNYRFSTTASGGKDTDGVVFNTESKTLLFLDGVLYHFSIVNEDGIPKQWSIEGDSIIELDSTESTIGKYMNISTLEKGNSLWIYARVKRNGSNGNWFISPEKYGCALKEDEVLPEGVNPGNSNYYYLLYGFCGVTKVGTPFFEPIYGNTWIKGSTIYTGKVLTMDGFSSLDLDNNTLKLGNDFYYANGLIIIGNPETGAFVFHKHDTNKSALHIGTRELDSDGNESWNGMTFADGELTIGKYDEKLQKMQELLDKEVSTWYGNGIPLPYKENTDGEVIDEVSEETLASYNNDTLILDEDGVWKFNLSPDPELLTYHINDIYINTESGVGYRLVVTNYGETTLQVYWLKLSLGDLLNILNSINSINSLVENIKEVLDITEDGQTTIGDKFVQTMMLRIGADSTNYTLSKTSTSGNRMKNLYWTRDTDEDGNEYTALRATESETLKHESYYYTTTDGRKIYIWDLNNSFDGSEDLVTVWDNIEYDLPIYLYIKCSTVSNSAGWYSSVNTHSLLEEIGDKMYYFFPFATITDPKNKELVEVRGNTKIIGDRIITGKLESNTGNSFFDLDNGLFALGVDLSDPDDLSKAAFSFDGSKVHIGSASTFDTHSILANISSILEIEGINGNHLIKTLPLLHLLLTRDSALYRVEEDLLVSIIPSSGSPVSTLTPEYIIFLATSNYKVGQDGVEEWPTDVALLTPGKIFLGKDGYSIYILWGISNEKFKNYEDQELDYMSLGVFQDFQGDLFNYNLYINPIHIKYYEELSFPMFSTTEISGGLVLTNILAVKNSLGDISAGICGIDDYNNKVAFWAGSSLGGKEDAPVKLSFSGLGSAIGPLTVSSKNTITIGADYTSLLLLSGGSRASITLLSATGYSESSGALGVKKFIISSDSIDTSATYPTNLNYTFNKLDSTRTTLKTTGSNSTWLTLYTGTLDFAWPTPIDKYTFVKDSVLAYIYMPSTNMGFVGFNKNSNNKFYLSGHFDLLINGSTVYTTSKIWDGPSRDSDYRGFSVSTPDIIYPDKDKADAPNGLMNILHDGSNTVQVRFRIERLSRETASSGIVYITGGVGAAHYDTYKSDITVLAGSKDIEKVAIWEAVVDSEGDDIENSLINYSGVSFRKGSNVVVLYVGGEKLLCRLSNLPELPTTDTPSYSLLVITKDGKLYTKE